MICPTRLVLGNDTEFSVDHTIKAFGLTSLASWVPRGSTTGAPGLHWHGGRKASETTRLLPSPPHHREDCHHTQHGEDGERDEGAGDPSGAKEQHESGVSRTEGNEKVRRSPLWKKFPMMTFFILDLLSTKESQLLLFQTCCLASGRIDCAGILKLRNADIEQKSNETDIGRKNTRVRLVFRVHIPQPGDQLLSLQVASDPIECCKES